MRDDSSLYTGVTSKAARMTRLKEQELERKRQKEEKRAKITDGADVVLELLAKEKENTVIDMLKAIDTKTPDDELKAKINALNLYKDSINSVTAKVKAILRGA